jgi:hypothetical protein
VRKFGLPPVVDENTEILILGTLPSDKSLAEHSPRTSAKFCTGSISGAPATGGH